MRPTSRPYIDVTRDCLGPSVMELVLVLLVSAIGMKRGLHPLRTHHSALVIPSP